MEDGVYGEGEGFGGWERGGLVEGEDGQWHRVEGTKEEWIWDWVVDHCGGGRGGEGGARG